MNEKYCSIEQMQKLQSLGFDITDSEHCLCTSKDGSVSILLSKDIALDTTKIVGKDYHHTYDLFELISKFPFRIETRSAGDCCLNIEKSGFMGVAQHSASIRNNNGYQERGSYKKDIVEALAGLLIRAIELGYVDVPKK